MGRPLDTRTGPPITIYVPAFARLRDRLAALDGHNVPSAIHDDTQLPPNFLTIVANLFVQSCKLYDTEALREDAVLPLLETLLDLQLSRRHKMSPGERQAEFDAVECVPLRNKSQAYSVFLEVKNELGIAGASGIQCAFIYEKAVALPSVRTTCQT